MAETDLPPLSVRRTGGSEVPSGSLTLLVRDADGRPERAMEADETLY